jgi:hypothetical protein
MQSGRDCSAIAVADVFLTGSHAFRHNPIGGNRQDDRRAGTFDTFQVNRRIMESGNRICHRETNSNRFKKSGSRTVGLAKRLQDVIEYIGRDARASVLKLDLNAVILQFSRGDRDFCSGFGEFDRIVEDTMQDPRKRIAVE